MEIASRLSWKVLPEPALREWFKMSRDFTNEEAGKLRCGHIPREMEDKWFIFFENDWLYFCRSWTGACIYGMHLKPTAAGVCADEYWASRDPEHFHSSDMDRDQALLPRLLALILEDVEAP